MRRGVAPPSPDAFGDDESDVGVKDGTDEGRFELFAGAKGQRTLRERSEDLPSCRSSVIAKFPNVLGDDTGIPDGMKTGSGLVEPRTDRVDLPPASPFKAKDCYRDVSIGASLVPSELTVISASHSARQV